MSAGQKALHDRLRALIHETAASTDGVGAIAESVKWGEPSFAPEKPRIGSSVRLADRPDGSVAMMFICHTGLVGQFRDLYPDSFAYEGNRALVFEPADTIDTAALSHCVAMALTWYLNRRRNRKS
jgi:hypothetical protein